MESGSDWLLGAALHLELAPQTSPVQLRWLVLDFGVVCQLRDKYRGGGCRARTPWKVFKY